MTILDYIAQDIKNNAYNFTYMMYMSIFFFAILIYYEARRNILYSLGLMVLIYLIICPFYIWMGLDFIGISIILIYIGAVPILFLFVLMSIDTSKHKPLFNLKNVNILSKIEDILDKKENLMNYMIINGVILFLLVNFFFVLNFFLINQLIGLNFYDYELSAVNDAFHVLYPFFYNINMIGFCLIKFYKLELYLFALLLFIGFIALEIIFLHSKKK